MLRLAVAIVVFALVGAGAYALSLRPEPVAETEELSARLDALAAEVARLREQVQVQPSVALSAITGGAPLSALRRDSESLVKHRDEQHAIMAKVEVGFREERRDESWSSATETTIRSVLGDNSIVRETVRNVECLTKTCRVEMQTKNVTAVSNALSRLLRQFRDTFSGTRMDYVDSQDGSQTVIMYLSRNDNAIPAFSGRTP